MNLKHWILTFDTRREKIFIHPTWVKLSGLPLELWTPGIFTLIEASLGEFILYDDSFVASENMPNARVLVELDLCGGLSETIVISRGI